MQIDSTGDPVDLLVSVSGEVVWFEVDTSSGDWT